MTQLAIYKKGKGQEDSRIQSFFRKDYIRYQVYKTVFLTTISYMLLLGVLAGYYFEELTQQFFLCFYGRIIRYCLLFYVVLLFGEIFCTKRFFQKRYEQAQERQALYCKEMQQLFHLYEEKEEEQNNDIFSGLERETKSDLSKI